MFGSNPDPCGDYQACLDCGETFGCQGACRKDLKCLAYTNCPRNPDFCMKNYNENKKWCQARDKPETWTNDPTSYIRNRGQERAATGTTLIKNVTVIIGNGASSDAAPTTQNDILIKDGKIESITPVGSSSAAAATTIDGSNLFATPGIVDMHSHTGVYSYPDDLRATSDGNEATNPNRVYVRAIDAYDPADFAIRGVRSGGVTTSMVIPGSANVEGGEGLMIKMVDANTVSEMVIDDASRLVKMACGENPKRVYGGRGTLPSTRMGIAWVMRAGWWHASQVMRKQTTFCANLEPNTEHFTDYIDLETEPLIGIMKGYVRLMIHCYQTNDMEMVIRLGEEFGFMPTAFHHALEAWKIADMLKAKGIGVATFSDLWGYKWEAWDASVYAPKILGEKGVQYSLKSDHPVIDAADLMYEAGKSAYYGAKPEAALASLFSSPAKLTGTINRVGTLEKGKDGDIALWTTHPLTLGSLPTKVFIEGKLYHDGVQTDPKLLSKYDQPSQATLQDSGNVCKPDTVDIGGREMPYPTSNSTTLGTYVIKGVSIYTMTDSMTQPVKGDIYVKDGKIQDFGSSVSASGVPTITINGGIAVPGLVEANSLVGTWDISQESVTKDGSSTGDGADLLNVTRIDGARLRSKHQVYTLHSGVTTVIMKGPVDGVVAGLQSSMGLYGEYLSSKLNNMKGRASGLEFNVGNSFKDDGITGSISGQIRKIEDIITSSKDKYPITAVTKGEIPIVFNADQADEIKSIIELSKRLKSILGGSPRFILQGAAEGHLLRDELKAADFGVILSPVRCVPDYSWELLRCNRARIGDWGEYPKLAIAYESVHGSDNDNPRNLRWEAGWAVTYGMPYLKALRSITSGPSDMFGLKDSGRIKKGAPADFVVYSGNPLSFDGRPLFIGVSGRVLCNPKMY